MNPKSYIRDGRAPIPDREITSVIMSSIRGRDTKPEVMLRKALWHAGMRGYRVNWKWAAGRPDVCFPGKKVAVFVHGCFWHRCPTCKPALPKSHRGFWRDKFTKNIARDRLRQLQLRNEGWRVIVVWECQTRNAISIEKAVAVVSRALISYSAKRQPTARQKPQTVKAGSRSC